MYWKTAILLLLLLPMTYAQTAEVGEIPLVDRIRLGLDTAIERIQLAITRDPESRQALQLRIVQERLEEIRNTNSERLRTRLEENARGYFPDLSEDQRDELEDELESIPPVEDVDALINGFAPDAIAFSAENSQVQELLQAYGRIDLIVQNGASRTILLEEGIIQEIVPLQAGDPDLTVRYDVDDVLDLAAAIEEGDASTILREAAKGEISPLSEQIKIAGMVVAQRGRRV